MRSRDLIGSMRLMGLGDPPGYGESTSQVTPSAAPGGGRKVIYVTTPLQKRAAQAQLERAAKVLQERAAYNLATEQQAIQAAKDKLVAESNLRIQKEFQAAVLAKQKEIAEAEARTQQQAPIPQYPSAPVNPAVPVATPTSGVTPVQIPASTNTQADWWKGASYLKPWWEYPTQIPQVSPARVIAETVDVPEWPVAVSAAAMQRQSRPVEDVGPWASLKSGAEIIRTGSEPQAPTIPPMDIGGAIKSLFGGGFVSAMKEIFGGGSQQQVSEYNSGAITQALAREKELEEMAQIKQAAEEKWARENMVKVQQPEFSYPVPTERGLVQPIEASPVDLSKLKGPFAAAWDSMTDAIKDMTAPMEEAAKEKDAKRFFSTGEAKWAEVKASDPELYEQLRGETMRDIERRTFVNDQLDRYYTDKILYEAHGYRDRNGKFVRSDSGEFDGEEALRVKMKYANELSKKFDVINAKEVLKTLGERVMRSPEGSGYRAGAALPFGESGLKIAEREIAQKTLESTAPAIIYDIEKYRNRNSGEWSADSATNMLSEWISKMRRGAKTQGLSDAEIVMLVAKRVANELKSAKSSIARAYTSAAQSKDILSQTELQDKMYELARTLNALREDIATRATPTAVLGMNARKLFDMAMNKMKDESAKREAELAKQNTLWRRMQQSVRTGVVAPPETVRPWSMHGLGDSPAGEQVDLPEPPPPPPPPPPSPPPPEPKKIWIKFDPYQKKMLLASFTLIALYMAFGGSKK